MENKTNRYDSADNRLTAVLYPTDKALTYSFDPVGNRTMLLDSDGGYTTYTYSADGMREKKATSSGTVYFVRDGENVLIEADANLVTQAHYTDYPGEWGGLSSERRGINSSFYDFDQQSNAGILVSIFQVQISTQATK